MFCINCGTQNEADSAFCIKCGAKLTQGKTPAATKATPKSAPKAAPKSAAKTAPKSAANKPVNPPVVQINNNYNPGQQTQVQAPTQEGVLSAAWHDITSTPGWFKKVLLMALFNMIPFLDLGTIGYSQK